MDVNYNQQKIKQRPNGVKYTKAAIASDDLYGRIASSKEAHPAAQAVLIKYGYEQASTETELAHKLASVVMNVGESALKDIASIHPDKELILSFCSAAPLAPPVIPAVPAVIKEKASLHDCGCGGDKHMNSSGSQYLHAEAAIAAATEQNKYLKPALLISVSVLLAAVIWKQKL